ncbi:MAG: ThiF family adenylyltransferase [Microbacteriaceae bacterium]
MPDAERHLRQTILPGFGRAAQDRLAAARVLVIGAGGLGSAVIPALVGAGVGTIGVVDDDRVELSNLHRQTLHGVADVGDAKVASAARAAARIDPGVRVREHRLRLDAGSAPAIVDGYDVIVDGSDNFATRFLADDLAAERGLPLVWGSVSQYGGQAGVAWAERGPRYRDLVPEPPAADAVPSCAEGGVFPPTVAVIGAILASETLKLITGIGDPLIGRVTLYDARSGAFEELGYATAEPAGPGEPGGPTGPEPTGSEPAGSEPAESEPAGSGSEPVWSAGSTTAEPTRTEPARTELAATELAALLADRPGAVRLIDVREPWEHELAAIPGSWLLPLGSLPDAIPALDPEAAYVVYCHLGVRSHSALDYLLEQGFTDVRHLVGGIDAWSAEVSPETPRY